VVLDGEFDPEAPPAMAPIGNAAYPQPAYGYGGVSDQKQVRVGEVVSGDGAVPLFHRAFDGNQADVGTVVAVMEAVRRHLPLPDCLIVGDTKLLSASVQWKLRGQNLHFLAPLPHSADLDAQFLALPAENWEVLDYCSQEQLKRPAEARTQYLGQEVGWEATDPKTGKTERFRRVFIISSEERDACRKVRNRRLTQAASELNEVLGKTGKGRLKTREQVVARVNKILEQRKVQGLLTVKVRMRQELPELTWELNEEALRAAERLDGYYVLLTSLPAEEQEGKLKSDPGGVLRRWKEQWKIERRFHEWKGPLQVRPVFVTSPQRIAAFLLILHLALMLFCLLEREARQALARRGKTKLTNLLAGHVDAIPTGANLLAAFENLLLVIEEDPPELWGMTPLTTVQENIYRLLGVPVPQMV
jgi:transposase